MNFEILAQNHLALNGNFDNFDFSMFTNIDLSETEYKNFCYYKAGFHGYPDLDITPEKHFVMMIAALRGDQPVLEEINWGKSTPYKVLGISKREFGAFTPLTYRTAAKNKAATLMQHCLLNPDFQPLKLAFNDGDTKNISIFQYVALQIMNKKRVTVQALKDLNVISFQHLSRTSQCFFIVPTLYSTIAEADFNDILSDIYSRIIQFCSQDFINNHPYFPMNAINFSLNQPSEKLQKFFTLQTARAGALGLTLNETMHLFGMSIPDVLYSFSQFGTLVVKNYDGSYVYLDGDSAVTCEDALSFLGSNISSSAAFEVNIDDFNSAWQPLRKSNVPGRIDID